MNDHRALDGEQFLDTLEDRGALPIGAFIAQHRRLSAEQVEQILAVQRERSLRFGEAAVALGFATDDDVKFALAQQFHYPYARDEARSSFGPELVTLNKPFGVQAEAFRAIRSQLMVRSQDEPRRALAVVSPQSGDGKTFFCANLAVVLAQLGERTLLLDADMRGPRQHELFGISNQTGLSGILSGRAASNVVQPVPGVPSLFVLPVGVTPPNPLELVERSAFGVMIRALLEKFEHVVVDTPAAEYGSDAAVIAARCGSVLMVARKNRGRVSDMQDMLAHLQYGPTRMMGVVYNEF